MSLTAHSPVPVPPEPDPAPMTPPLPADPPPSPIEDPPHEPAQPVRDPPMPRPTVLQQGRVRSDAEFTHVPRALLKATCTFCREALMKEPERADGSATSTHLAPAAPSCAACTPRCNGMPRESATG